MPVSGINQDIQGTQQAGAQQKQAHKITRPSRITTDKP